MGVRVKKDLKDVMNEMGDQLHQAGKAASDAIRDKEKREEVRSKARKTAHDVADTVADLVDGLSESTRTVLQSEEVEGAIEGVGTMFKGWAAKIREARTQQDEPAEHEPSTEADDADEAEDSNTEQNGADSAPSPNEPKRTL